MEQLVIYLIGFITGAVVGVGLLSKWINKVFDDAGILPREH